VNLKSLVRQVLTETGMSDPHEVAAEVSRRVRGAAALREALAEALVVYVRTSFTRDLMRPSGEAAAQVPSAKVAACRSEWQRRLLTPLGVDGVFKRFGDCTADDLRAVAASLRLHADQTAAKADYYEALASALPAGAVVADLDADPLAVAA